MSSPTIVAVVPARMASSRFPGKPLVHICGVPMIEHVRRRTLLADGIDDVVVATCDESILRAVTQAGGRAVMTADTHERCTDRVEEAMRELEGDIVLIVQGDEPLLRPDVLPRVAAPLLDRPDLVCTNLLSPLEGDADLANPDIVKAACAGNGDIMFLTRAPVPYFRRRAECPVYRQTGVMALRAEFLHKYAALPATPFEIVESIDMMRVLEHGYRIAGVVADFSTIGVDNPDDVPLVERLLEEDAVQKALFERTKGVAQ